jgi:flagellar protein FliO/FliZ
MRRLALLIAVSLMLPTGAYAAGGGPDIAGGLAQMVGSLVLVIGIILILYWAAGKFLKVPQGGGSRYIRVVETKHLAPKKSLVLVEVGGEYLLLSNSGEGVSLLKQVQMVEEIEVVDERAALVSAQLKKRLKVFASELPAGVAARLGQFKKSGGFA